MSQDATVNAGDIARLADVGRAAVSNWRRRYEDFPQPVGGTASSPLFSLPEVEKWLRRNGKAFEVSLGDRIWQRLKASADDLHLGELLGHAGAFLLYTRRDPGGWEGLADSRDLVVRLPHAVAAATPDLPVNLGSPDAAGARLADPGLIRLLAEMAERDGAAETFEFLCERYVEAHSRRLSITRPEIAGLMARLACPEGGSVLDPACGLGTLLLAVQTERALRPDAPTASQETQPRVPERDGQGWLLGQDASETGALLAALRLLLRGHRARIVGGDALRHDGFSGERADAVVCDPPFNERAWGHEDLIGDPRWDYGMPPRGESELAWVQHCLAHVRPGGLVAILMPSAAASRRPGRRIRANLLRAGALRAVVTLSPGGPDLWLLRRPRAGERQPTAILLADAGEDLSLVEPAWRAHLAESEPPSGGRTVRIIDLLDDEVDVSPARHLSAGSDTRGFPDARDRLVEAAAVLAQAMAESLPDLEVLGEGELGWDTPVTTVAELVKAGLVTVLHSTLKASDEPMETRGHPIWTRGLPTETRSLATEARSLPTETGSLPTETGSLARETRGRPAETRGLPMLTADDLARGGPPTGLAAPGPDLVTIEDGDIVGSPVTARVIEAGGAVLGPHLTVFRVDRARLDPEFLAGFLRFAAAGGRTHPGSRPAHPSTRWTSSRSTHLGASRVEARRARVPRIPLAEQRRYGRAFQQFLALEDRLVEAATAGEAFVRLGVEGIVDGRLRPCDPSSSS
ncbi:N-6 DNA methylase [Planotetraspora sp. A-T 1434]|uniref:N-6 DNA methylase n=1 Tax=Planotetraspora sp. A-T 1434 TaxID=2979219 RepID=UPI0021BFFDDF|nr:N-6 DNA methylase [Planotetraspora sp. A-T 1434]MCT9928986.1 N-6 DNA methylase [Planotetraspora sp. A-T 1434]